MIVYVVTSGDYSEYGIVAIFSTREKAEACVAPHIREGVIGEDWNVEEWELDAPAEPTAFHYRASVTLYENEGWKGVADDWPTWASYVGSPLPDEHVTVTEHVYVASGLSLTIDVHGLDPLRVAKICDDKVAEVRAHKLGLT